MVSGRHAERGHGRGRGHPRAGRPSAVRRGGSARRGACDSLIAQAIARLGGSTSGQQCGILYTADALDTATSNGWDTMAVNVNALFT